MTEVDTDLYGDDALCLRLITEAEVWAVVGLGTDQSRPAYGVAEFLQRQGKRIVPVHPRAETVLCEPGYKTLTEALAAVGRIDVVDCFVASKRVGDIVREAIGLKLPAIWMQLEVVDELAASQAREHGLDVVMNRCPAIEWRRQLG